MISEAISKSTDAVPVSAHEAVICTFKDSKDGAELPELAALGEYVAPVAEKPAKSKKQTAERYDKAPAVVGDLYSPAAATG